MKHKILFSYTSEKDPVEEEKEYHIVQSDAVTTSCNILPNCTVECQKSGDNGVYK